MAHSVLDFTELDYEAMGLTALNDNKHALGRLLGSHPKEMNDEQKKNMRAEIQSKLVIVSRLIQIKEFERDTATKMAKQEHVNTELPKKLSVLRWCVNPPSFLNMDNCSIANCKWFTPTETKIQWQRHVGKTVKNFEFDLLTIDADKFDHMVAHPFDHEFFRVENETLLIMVV